MPAYDKSFKKYHANGVIRKTLQGRYVGEFNRDDKRRRQTFKTQAEATKWLDSFGTARDKGGENVTKLTIAQMQDALKAFDHLHKHGHNDVTLFATAEYFVTGAIMRASRIKVGTVGEWFDRYMDYLTNPQDGGSPARHRTIENKRARLKSFLDACRDKDVGDVTANDVDSWLVWTGATGRNLLNFKTEIQSLFNFVAKQDAIAQSKIPEDERRTSYQNTVALFPQRKKKEIAPVSVFTPKQAEKLLRALECKSPSAALAVALGCFAGIRTAEITEGRGLAWEDIDFDSKEIRIPAELAKDREARDVPINDTMMAWLQRYRFEDDGTERSGRIAPSKWHWFELRREAAQSAKLTMTGNLARHSFGTFYGKLHGYRNASEIMGHSGDMAVFNQHYKGKSITEQQARDFFEIMPLEGDAKVIRMEAAI